jgi:uncharacterized membrane protein
MQTQPLANDAYAPSDRRRTATTQKIENGHGAGLAQYQTRAVRLARGLGWFSVALGAAEIVAPLVMARVAGAPIRRRKATTTTTTMRLLGARELINGMGILAQPGLSAWLWARVAGDAVDLALLGRTIVSRRAERTRTISALASVLGITALDVLAAVECQRNERGLAAPAGIHVLSAITVNRSREDVYRFWRDLENLPKFMAHLESVRVRDGRSTWRAKGPRGMSVEWDAEIVSDQPNENLAWRSCEGADVPNQGSVRFLDAPGGRGTEVRVELRYDPPAGALGAAIAKLFGAEPGQEIAGDLRRFKQVLETGEVLHSDASIHRGMHPARPSEASELEEGRQVTR